MTDRPDPQPVLSEAMAVELMAAPWRGATNTVAAVDPYRAATELAVVVAGSVTEAVVPEQVVDTLDAATYILGTEAVAVVTQAFVPGLLCAASHSSGERDLLVRHLPAELWQRWHQTHQELEAASVGATPVRRPPRTGSLDAAYVYRAESGELVRRPHPGTGRAERRSFTPVVNARLVMVFGVLLILTVLVTALR